MFPAAGPGPGPPAGLWRALLQQARASAKREAVVDAEVFLALLGQEHLYATGTLPRPTPATVYPYGFLLSPAGPPLPAAPSPPPAPDPADSATARNNAAPHAANPQRPPPARPSASFGGRRDAPH
jgi:hypothetical protein